MYNKAIFYCFTFVSFVIALASCKEEEVCTQSTDVTLNIGLFSILNDTVEVDSVVSSFSAIGLGLSDSLYSSVSDVSSIRLQLNPYSEKTVYYLKFGPVADTMTIETNRSLKLLSEACGFITTYEVKGLTNSLILIDSVAIIESSVTNEVVQHVKMYF